MQTLVSDTFAAYADGELPTVSGGKYVKPTGFPNTISVLSHLAKGTQGNENVVALTPTGFAGGSTTGQWSQITVGTYDDFFGPSVFHDSTLDFYYLDLASGAASLYRVKGSFTNLATLVATGVTPVPGDVLRLEVQIVAGSPVLTAFRNGVQLGVPFTDGNASEKIVGGYPGFRQWNTVSRVSKFEAGDFGTGGTTPPLNSVSDDFSTYVDGLLPVVSGGFYATPTQSGFQPLAVASHLVKGSGSGENETYVPGWAGSLTAQWAAITINGADDFMGPSVYNNGVGNFYYLEAASGIWNIVRVVNGSFSSVFTGAALTLTNGDVFRLEVTLVLGAPSLVAKKNGTLLGGVIDNAANKLVSGKPGWRQWNTTSRVSKFEAGEIVATAPGGGGGGAPLTRLGETFG